MSLLLAGFFLTFAPQGGAPEQAFEDVRTTVERRAGELLKEHGVTGASVAVIDGGEIAWAAGFGRTRKKRPNAVTTRTLFQAASISKPVAALGALRLVANGTLSLDGDAQEKLASFRIPALRRLEGSRVTLRQLLSHSAGINVHGFPGYPSDGKVPSLLDILGGKRGVNTAPIRVASEPGKRFRYSGGGYCILQQLMIDAGGKAFPELMRDLVLAPLKMTHSSYEQPLPPDRAQAAANGHMRDGKGVRKRFHLYPEMAAAGLWTTPSDLARFAIAIQRAYAGADGAILPKKLARRMLTAEQKAGRGSIGLGFFLSGEGAALRFSHGGSNHGFKCFLEATATTGKGAVVMTNHDNGGRLGGALVKEIAKQYRW